MLNNKPKKILVAPLDWGLGHTTRCVPILRHIERLGHIPVFAGNISQQAFIQKIFPNISVLHLDGYNISYSASNRILQAGILGQLPRLINTIERERKWLEDTCKTQEIDAVISDNRYGLYIPNIPCVILIHQLMVRTGLGSAADRMLQRVHYRMLNHFDDVWIPDIMGNGNLAGALSHCASMPHNSKYIGLLSQFEGQEQINNGDKHVLVLLSGPEPARTVLSQLLWKQVVNLKCPVVFVEGNDDAATPACMPANMQYHKLVDRMALLPLLQQARLVVCRSGYSTIMDLVALQKKAVLVPTPGQTEQQYLATSLQERGLFKTASQSSLDLRSFPDQSDKMPARRAMPENEAFGLYKPILAQWLSLL